MLDKSDVYYENDKINTQIVVPDVCVYPKQEVKFFKLYYEELDADAASACVLRIQDKNENECIATFSADHERKNEANYSFVALKKDNADTVFRQKEYFPILLNHSRSNNSDKDLGELYKEIKETAVAAVIDDMNVMYAIGKLNPPQATLKDIIDHVQDFFSKGNSSSNVMSLTISNFPSKGIETDIQKSYVHDDIYDLYFYTEDDKKIGYSESLSVQNISQDFAAIAVGEIDVGNKTLKQIIEDKNRKWTTDMENVFEYIYDLEADTSVEVYDSENSDIRYHVYKDSDYGNDGTNNWNLVCVTVYYKDERIGHTADIHVTDLEFNDDLHGQFYSDKTNEISSISQIIENMQYNDEHDL